MQSREAETTRAAGRGGLAIAAAKVSFMILGFAQQFVLQRIMPSDAYGQVSLVVSIVSIVNNVIVAMGLQGVSRAVSQVPDAEANLAFRRALGVHACVAVALSLAFALASGTIASFAGAPELTGHVRLVSAVVLLYGIYAPLIGSLNGKRRFLEQAGLDVSYQVIRLCSMVGGAVLLIRSGGSGVMGALAGFVGAAALIVPIALTRTGVGERGGSRPEIAAYLGFLLPLFLGQSCLNLLMQTDTLLLSRFLGKAAASVKEANSLRGVYRNVQLFAFLPYQLLMSISFILFPMLARANAEGDREAVRGYTRTGIRLALVLTGLMVSAISGVAPHVLRLIAAEDIYWQGGGDALRILSLGMGAFSVLGITSTALTSLGRAVASWLLTAAGVILIGLGCFVLIPRVSVGPAMLVQAAIAVTAALTVTAVIAAVVLGRAAGGFVAPLSLVRVLVALGVAVAAGSRLPWMGKPMVVVEAVAIAAIYALVLVGTRELGAEDVRRIKQVIGRR